MSTRFLLDFVVVCCLIICCTSQDPCDSAQHNVINEDFKRSSGYAVTTSQKSDRYIDAGWYRFKGAQGEDMVTSSPGLQKCGTAFPIWLNGTIPSEGEGIVPREACVVGFLDDCSHRYDIQIKNCGTFRVYYHVPTDGTDEVYCIGTEIPCEANLYSANGYTPGCQPDVNECDVSNVSCDQICTNVVGAADSYECSCNNGYELSLDQHTCNDINECATNNGECGQICINSAGTYECRCNAGYLLNGDKKTCSDPCDPTQHNVINEDFERSSSYAVTTPPKSDRYIEAGWYRFKGAQGEDMVTSSPGMQKCGTTFPIWLKGIIPSEREGIARREACVVGFVNDCSYRYNIQIKNCGTFRVYYHVPTEGTDEVYCIGTEIPCEANLFSANGYTPGCQPDVNECDVSNGSCDQICTNVVGAADSYECSCNNGYELSLDQHTCNDINECATNNGECGQICINSAGTYECRCNAGYLLNGDNSTCSDINECATNNGGCAGNCTNSAGSYQCSCGPGYQLNGDGHGCDDINECATNNSGCAGSCTNSAGSYQCSCSSGYQLNADGHGCDDINECATNNSGCAGNCTNSAGSYQCGCAPGYQLNGDRHGCDDINECATNNSGCAGSCTNSAGSYQCSCSSGYQLNADGHGCDDINECATNNSGCAGNCTNSAGSYQCGCAPGYQLNGDRHGCDDINECATNNSGCAGSCTNSAGSYQCSCSSGYQLNADGHGCDDINECATNNSGCAGNCTNSAGSYQCGCAPGYQLNGDRHGCDDINECATNNSGCAGSCTNSAGSYQCSCSSGYQLNADGHGCDDINECATNNGGCAGSCTNSAGSYQCGCAPGYQLNGDGHGCDDVNECASNNSGCSDVCVNTGGSYNCACYTCQRLLPDGHTCILLEKPVLGNVSISWEVSVGSIFRSVVMKCDLDSPPTGLLYYITWYVGDIEVHFVEGAAASAFPVQLHETEWNNQVQIQQNLRCEVSARYYADCEPSNPASAEYFVGFTVDETILYVYEGGNPAYYTIRPTIPILCPKGFEHCIFPLEVHTPVSSKDKNTPATCSNGDILEQGALEFLQTPCRVDIPMTTQIDPNTAFRIAVSAAIDNVYDGRHSMLVNVAGPEIYQYHRLLSGAVLPEAEVIISDKDVDLSNSICKARNDPHMTTFDGRVYENQLEGEFILYKHTSLPIEVRGYFKKCSGYATCVCGVAVRSGADLFIYDSCRIFMQKPMRVRMYTCNDESITVKQETSKRYRITLPTGTQVVADRSWIHIQPSVADIGKVEGLCGTLDSDCSNDFQLKNGSFSTHKYANLPVCDKYKRGMWRQFHPNDFSASWRIDIFHSWYRGVVPESDKKGLEKVVYCSCPSGGKDAVCGNRPLGSASIQNCVVNDHDNNPVKKCISRSKRATNGDDIEDEVDNFEYDPNFVAATPDWPVNGITEAAARKHCKDAISSKQVLQNGHIMGLVNINGSVETCMADILLSGGTTYTHVHIEDPMEDIRREISRNMSLYSYNANTGEVTSPAALDDICPSDCSSHGTCVNGICACDANYGDADCSLRTDAVPELYDMPSNGLCDLQHRPCQATPVYGTPFVQSANFRCKITPVLLKNGEQVSQDSVVTQAEFDHLNRAMCPFPTLDNGLAEDVTAYAFQVAMTNDGNKFSEPKSVTVYDGRCIECPTGLNGSCVLTPGNCYIEQTCFEASDFNPLDSCERCDPNYSTHQWAPVYSDQCKSNDNTYVIIGLVLAVAIAGTAAVVAGVVYTIHKKNKKFTQVQDISKVDLNAIDA